MSSLYDHGCRTLSGEPFNLHALKGQVLLIVNIATHCRFTPQLAALQRLYERYHDQGLTLLAFPCDQFGHQSPGEGAEIARACLRYSVNFPLMEKTNVNGRDAHPLFKQIEREAPGVMNTQLIKWNFTKFLVGRDGKVLRRYAPTVAPEKLRLDIERALENPVAM